MVPKIALASPNHYVNTEFNSSTPTVIGFTDMRKALVCVNYELLMNKLETHGIRAISIQLFKSCLQMSTTKLLLLMDNNNVK